MTSQRASLLPSTYACRPTGDSRKSRKANCVRLSPSSTSHLIRMCLGVAFNFPTPPVGTLPELTPAAAGHPSDRPSKPGTPADNKLRAQSLLAPPAPAQGFPGLVVEPRAERLPATCSPRRLQSTQRLAQ